MKATGNARTVGQPSQTVVNVAWSHPENTRQSGVLGIDVELPKPFGAQKIKTKSQTLNVEIHCCIPTWETSDQIVIFSWFYFLGNRKHMIPIVSLGFL